MEEKGGLEAEAGRHNQGKLLDLFIPPVSY